MQSNPTLKGSSPSSNTGWLNIPFLHLTDIKKQPSSEDLLMFLTILKEPSPSFRLQKVTKADI